MISASVAEVLIFEDLEGPDFVGYTVTGATGVSLSSFQAVNTNSDIFIRTTSTSAGGAFGDPVSGFSGNFIALEDIDSLSAFPTPEGFLTLDPISGPHTAFALGITIAAPDATASRYEFEDLIELQYRVDGGNWITAPGTTFRGNGVSRGLFNDGTNVTTAATDVLVNLTGVESSSEFQARVRFLSDTQEEMAFDDFFVSGQSIVPEPSSSLFAGLACFILAGFRRRA